jgi:glycosyltransferase involved in cell wall biosynthesis
MRIVFLWTRLSGYLNACLKELASRPGVDLLVVNQLSRDEAPFDDEQFGWIPERFAYVSRPNGAGLLDRVRDFRPDAIFVSSWHIKAFRFVLERQKDGPARVLCMDNQWRGTLKQWLGVAGARWYLRGLYDAAFVPGERQACFARRLGFRADEIWQGLLCPDTAALAGRETSTPSPRNFGFLGRLSNEKGVLDLLAAYEAYRRTAPNPWGLTVAGTGPLEEDVRGHPKVSYVGFIQPDAIGDWFAGIGCLVLPSLFEPWGVAISEAAAAGLPIVATDACGAVPHLVHDFANGRIARTGDRASIARCMAFVANIDDDGLVAMGRVSQGLSGPYTPRRWADTVLEIASRSAHHDASQ